MNEITLPLIIFGALGDSINPCAYAVLVLLVSFLRAVKKDNRKFLIIGLIYVLFVYITYFIAGIGLMTFVKELKISKAIYVITAIASVVAGFINIKDVFWEGKGFSLKIPESRKPFIKKYIQKASIPAAVVLGIVVSFFELPCTGGVYFSITALLADRSTYLQSVLYLLLYNFIFIFPLIIILLVAFFSVSSETLSTWQKKNKRLMRFVLGLVMILLGVIMLWDRSS